MARLQFTLNPTAEIVTGTSAKTLVQVVAPTNQRVAILGWGIYFDATSVTAEPIQVELLRQTTAGTMSSLTPRKVDSDVGTAIQSTAQHTSTAEPTAGDILQSLEVHPQSGYECVFPLGQEFVVPGGGRVGLRVTAPATANARVFMRCEE